METRIAATKDVPAGQMLGIEHQDQSIVVANVDGKFYAIGNICTHMECMLSDGILTGEKVECPCHGSTFDVRTGAVLKGPADEPEPVFKLTIEGEQILLIT
ncbi:MAG TPA: non-heme iron oxygenase ferredoxin subunit [Dehalococcoidales bacterium]